jgi:hypothetical protein
VLCAACSAPPAPVANETKTNAAGEANSQPAVSGQKSPSQGIDRAVLQTICASEFGGGMARVTVWRDAAGAGKLLELSPDLSRFSHPPMVLHDAQGQELLFIPERPVTPEERKNDPVLQKAEALRAGLSPDKNATFCEEL